MMWHGDPGQRARAARGSRASGKRRHLVELWTRRRAQLQADEADERGHPSIAPPSKNKGVDTAAEETVPAREA